jgi:hypothetical protein
MFNNPFNNNNSFSNQSPGNRKGMYGQATPVLAALSFNQTYDTHETHRLDSLRNHNPDTHEGLLRTPRTSQFKHSSPKSARSILSAAESAHSAVTFGDMDVPLSAGLPRSLENSLDSPTRRKLASSRFSQFVNRYEKTVEQISERKIDE